MRIKLLLLFILLFGAIGVFAQPISQSSLLRFYESIGDIPGSCNVNLRSQATIVVKNVGIYRCQSGVYVFTETAAGVASLNGRTGALSLILSDIPNLPASQVTSGTFSASRIPSLPTSIITSGVFSTSLIPNLPASQITSGTFSTARLGTGTATSNTCLKGDGTWQACSNLISGLGDTNISSPSNGQVLQYDSGTSKWVNATAASGSAYTLNSASYASLGATITAIGATAATVTVTQDLPCSTAVIVPVTLRFEGINGAKIVKSSGCTINFQGMGLVNPESQTQLFSGFSSGNITWSGSVYPNKISTSLFSTTDLTAALNVLSGAFTSKAVTFMAFPSTITGIAEIYDKQNVEFQAGEFPNNATVYPQFRFRTNSRFTGQGDASVVYESSTVNVDNYRAQVFGFPLPTSSAQSGIYFDKFKIAASNLSAVSNQSTATIYLGNCSNCAIENMSFDRLIGFPAPCGGFGDTGNISHNCHIRNNYFYGVSTQMAVIFNCDNCSIVGNTFVLTDKNGVYISAIDIEPNVNGDDVLNVRVSDNIIDGRLRQNDFYSAIVVNGTAANTKLQSIQVSGNLLLENDDSIVASSHRQNEGIIIIKASNVIVDHNQIQGCGQVGIGLIETYNTKVSDNQSFNCGNIASNFLIQDALDSVVENNWLRLPAGFPVLEYGYNNIVEEITTNRRVNVSGTTVTRANNVGAPQDGIGAGAAFPYWYKDRTITINGTPVVVTAVSGANNTQLTIGTNLGVLTNVPLVLGFSNNTYKDNRGAWYTFPASTTSRNLTSNSLSTDVSPGNDACLGTTTLVAGAVTVNTRCAITGSRVYVTVRTPGGTRGNLSAAAVAGSMTINSTSLTETSIVQWQIVN